MKNKKLLGLLALAVVLGGVVAFGAFSPEDSGGAIRRALFRAPATSAPNSTVRPNSNATSPVRNPAGNSQNNTTEQPVDLNAGVQNVHFSTVPSSPGYPTYSVACAGTPTQEWQTVGRFNINVTEAPFTFQTIYVQLAKLNNSGGVSNFGIGQNYRFTIENSSGATLIQQEVPVTPGSSYVTVAIPAGIYLASSDTYILRVEVLDISSSVYTNGAKVILQPVSTDNNSIGVFSQSTSYEASASVSTGNVSGAHGAITIACS